MRSFWHKLPWLFSGCLALAAQAADLPQTVDAVYSSSLGIPARMQFAQNGGTYRIAVAMRVPLLYRMNFESSGTLNGRNLQTTAYTDLRNGKVYALAKIAGGTAEYGKRGETKSERVSGSVLDLFALSWQIAFNQGRLPQPLLLTNGKKLYPAAALKPEPAQQMMMMLGRTVSVQGYKMQQGDDEVYCAVAPALGEIPAVIRYNDGKQVYTLTLQSAAINGKTLSF